MVTVKQSGPGLSATLARIAERATNASVVRVGFFSGATYPDGTSVPLVAAIQEFGAPSRGIPPRPFFRNMIAKHKGEWPAAAMAALKATDYDAAKTLGQIGEVIAGQLREGIQQLYSPPLKPATIKRKGFAKPLVDTGQLLQSISYEVE